MSVMYCWHCNLSVHCMRILSDMLDLHCTGHTVTIGGGHIHVYPYDPRNPSGPPRLAQMHKHFCSEALSTAQTVRSVLYFIYYRSEVF